MAEALVLALVQGLEQVPGQVLVAVQVQPVVVVAEVQSLVVAVLALALVPALVPALEWVPVAA